MCVKCEHTRYNGAASVSVCGGVHMYVYTHSCIFDEAEKIDDPLKISQTKAPCIFYPTVFQITHNHTYTSTQPYPFYTKMNHTHTKDRDSVCYLIAPPHPTIHMVWMLPDAAHAACL